MIPWIIGGLAAAGVVAYRLLSDDKPERPYSPPYSPPYDEHAVLRQNVVRLRQALTGSTQRRIAVVGQPGAGKSSLVLELTRGRAKPQPVVGAQTDATDWSIDQNCNLECYDGKNLYVDFPGHGTRRHPAEVLLPISVLQNLDVVLFVWRGKFLADDERVLTVIRNSSSGALVIGVRAACDDTDSNTRDTIERDWRRACNQSWAIQFCSRRTGEGMDELRRILEG